jgi:hypothetical protein
MKKVIFKILSLSVFCVFISCASVSLDYPQPVFDKANVHVIDSYTVDGSMEDYVKIHNNSRDSDISFNIYVHDPDKSQWLVFGTGFLKGSGDTDTIDSDIDDLEGYRYFAIESLNDKDYGLTFSKSHNDLNIHIIDK